MSDTLTDLLGRGEDALARHSDEEALGLLLEAWRLARDARIAALVERLSKRLTHGLSPLECEPGSLLLTECHPLDLPRVLATVHEGADRGFPGALRQSLRAFHQWPADPRFTPVLLAIAHMPVAGDLRVPEALCELLTQVGDPRALAPLQALHARLAPDSDYARRLGVALQLLPTAGLPLDAAATARCEALEDALCAREESDARAAPLREALLARVHADLDDLSARMVLADHLLERGDPLGELISLQCQPRPDEARVEQLLDAHRSHWEAPLGPAVVRGNTRFQHGFPVAVRMSRWWNEQLPEPAPCWTTVREIDWAGAQCPDVAAWLAHPHLRHVTRLRQLEPEMGLELGRRGLPVRDIEVLGPIADKCPKLFSRLCELPHLTHLRVITSNPEDVRLCATTRLGSRLERFEARDSGAWTLGMRRAKDAAVLATLVAAESAEPLAAAIRGAAGFGIRVLHLRVQEGTWRARKQLESAAFGYERVEWS